MSPGCIFFLFLFYYSRFPSPLFPLLLRRLFELFHTQCRKACTYPSLGWRHLPCMENYLYGVWRGET